MWLEPEKAGDFEVPVGARVTATVNGQTVVVDDEGKVSSPSHFTSLSLSLFCIIYIGPSK